MGNLFIKLILAAMVILTEISFIYEYYSVGYWEWTSDRYIRCLIPFILFLFLAWVNYYDHRAAQMEESVEKDD